MCCAVDRELAAVQQTALSLHIKHTHSRFPFMSLSPKKLYLICLPKHTPTHTRTCNEIYTHIHKPQNLHAPTHRSITATETQLQVAVVMSTTSKPNHRIESEVLLHPETLSLDVLFTDQVLDMFNHKRGSLQNPNHQNANWCCQGHRVILL